MRRNLLPRHSYMSNKITVKISLKLTLDNNVTTQFKLSYREKTVRLAFFYASLRHVDFPNCKTKTSKCFNGELEIHKKQIGSLRLLSLEKIETPRHLGQKFIIL